MKYILIKRNRKIADEVLLSDIRRVAKMHGRRTLARAVYGIDGNFGRTTIRFRFGSWNRALAAAGLEVQKLAFITTPQLMQNLKQVWHTLGRQPYLRDMSAPLSAYSADVYVRRFGTWIGALEAFVKSAGRRKNIKLVIPKRTGKTKRRRTKDYVTKSLRYDILKRDNFKCRLCGASPAIKRGVTLHIDHIIPRSKNGETTPANLQTLCSDCNYGKGGK